MKRRPYQEFAVVEQEALRPLPQEPFQVTTWTRAKVGRDCHIQVARALYSIPYRYVGKTLEVRLTDHLVECFLDEELVKVHLREAPRGRSTRLEDYPPEKAQVLKEKPQWCRERARALGPQVAWVVESLLEQPTQNRLRQARGVLRLTERSFSWRFSPWPRGSLVLVRTAWKLPAAGPKPLAIPPTAPLRGFWRRGWSGS